MYLIKPAETPYNKKTKKLGEIKVVIIDLPENIIKTLEEMKNSHEIQFDTMKEALSFCERMGYDNADISIVSY